MDFGTIFGLIILIICVLAVLLVNSNKKKKEKQFSQTLFDLAEKSNSKISEYDFWNNTLIGIDKDSHKLFFIRKTDGNVITNEIDLSEIQKSRIVNSARIVDNKVSSSSVTDKLELSFSYRNPKKNETLLEFYNNNTDSLTVYRELKLIEKWSGMVNESIVEINPKK